MLSYHLKFVPVNSCEFPSCTGVSNPGTFLVVDKLCFSVKKTLVFDGQVLSIGFQVIAIPSQFCRKIDYNFKSLP